MRAGIDLVEEKAMKRSNEVTNETIGDRIIWGIAWAVFILTGIAGGTAIVLIVLRQFGF